MNRRLAIATLIFINILWGSSYAVSKVALLEIPPTLLGAARWTTATVILWLIHGWQRWHAGQSRDAAVRAVLKPVAQRDRVRLLALGAFGIGLAYVIDYIGINLTTATDASLMIIGEVIFTSLLATLITHDPLGRTKIVGMVTGALGVLILVLGHITESNSGDRGWLRAFGDLLILITLALQAVYTVLGTDLARKYPPLTVLTYVCTGSIVVWVPMVSWHLAAGTMPTALSLKAIGAVLYLAVVTSVFCNAVWFAISSRIGAGVSAISLFAQPLVGSFLGLVLLGEPFTPTLLIGALLIFTALYLTTVER
ncbi:MAG: DMT family transporter [Caldilineaceae bacterium]